jgi:transketolase
MNKKKIDFRNIVFEELINIRKKNSNMFILSADLSANTLDVFKEKYPKNFINLGITEQGMISAAAGMAMCGIKIFAFSMTPFLILRSFEHIKVDISCTNMPITLIGLGSGLSFDNAGPTAHSTTDIALMKTLPNFTIFNPSDPATASYCIRQANILKNPSYIRLDKSQQVSLYKKNKNFSDGYVETKDGNEICIISTGVMVHVALNVQKKIKNYKKKITVVDIFLLHPIKEKKLLNIIKKYKKILILDENTFNGGISSIISCLMIKHSVIRKTKFICLPNEHCFSYGSRAWLHKNFKLDEESILKSLNND